MKILEHNVETGEIIERDATTEEIQASKSDIASAKAERKDAEEKAIAKQAILDRLGLTADEAALLLK